MKLSSFRRSTRPLTSLIALATLGLLAVLVVSACGSNQARATATPSPTLTLTPTFPPTLTPTPLPLGTRDNPFVIGLVVENDNPQVAASAAALASRISTLANVTVVGKVFPTYNQLLEAMGNKQAHIAWMPPLTYVYASSQHLATVAILTNHFGVYAYGTQFLANVSSGFTPYYDPISGLSAADAKTALAQFKGLRPCWVEPGSASGYILPAGLMLINQYSFQPGVLTQTHTAVVRALYIKGVCDFGATFAISGDPRTASAVQDDLPDAMNRILIIWRSDAVIPNTSLTLLASLSEADRQTLTTAFLDLAKAQDGKALLSLSAGNYQVDEVKSVQDSLYDPLRGVVNALNIDLKDMVGK